jgi:hypothetical protein
MSGPVNKGFTQGDDVSVTEGEYAGYTGRVYGNPLPRHGAIGTPSSRFGEAVYRVQLNNRQTGEPIRGGAGQALVRESWLRKKSFGLPVNKLTLYKGETLQDVSPEYGLSGTEHRPALK